MTSAGHSSLVRSHPALAALPLTAVAVLVGLICLAGAAAMPATAHAAVARGIADSSLTEPTTEATQQNTIDEIQQLHATYVRIFVSWALAAPAAQPAAAADPAFDLSSPYMLGVQSAITKANADGLKVVVTIFESPPWATDSSHWPKGVYQPYVVIKPAGLAYFRAFCQQFAAQFAGQVAAYECWNEPNLGRSLYPQRTSSDSHFAEEHYLSMLKVFKPAIESGDPVHKPIIVGGATAPTGIGETPRRRSLRHGSPSTARGPTSTSTLIIRTRPAATGTWRLEPSRTSPRRRSPSATCRSFSSCFPRSRSG